jgi:hypothetical protein
VQAWLRDHGLVAAFAPSPNSAVYTYVHGDVLDLSKASDFYQWEAAVAEALDGYVERLRGSQYKLKNGFETSLQSLPLFLSGQPLQPADDLAHALFQMAQIWARRRYVDSWPGDWRCTRSEALSNEWKQKERSLRHRIRALDRPFLAGLDARWFPLYLSPRPTNCRDTQRGLWHRVQGDWLDGKLEKHRLHRQPSQLHKKTDLVSMKRLTKQLFCAV